jgi:hypothetical protein
MTSPRVPRPYTATTPRTGPSSDELRARIPGWGVDLDPADRPSVPREHLDGEPTGAHWTVPERQPEFVPRERSVEHGMLPPVFGTAQPLHGISGAIRRASYARYSEGRAAHWLLLMLADRVDVVESTGRSLFSTRPDLPMVGTGLHSELTHHGLRERRDNTRADVGHHALDPLVIAGPWLLGGWLVVRAVRAVSSRS